VDPLARLTDTLRADPPDRASWAVLADLLLERGDPFGEIVGRALQGRSSVALLQAARERRDDAYWPEALLSWPYEPVATWRLGLWDQLELVIGSLGSEQDPTVAALQEICAHPAARSLRSLHLSFDPQMDWEDHLYVPGALAALRVPLSLDLEGARCDGLGALARLPELRALQVWSLPLAEPLEHLRSLSLTGPIEADVLPPLDRMPALRELSLTWLAPPALDWGALPLLSHLGLQGPLPRPEPVWRALAEQSSLRSLDLGDPDALASLPAALAERLRSLSLWYAGEDTFYTLLRLPELETLQLTSCVPPHEVLAALPQLRSLDLRLSRELPDLGGLDLDRLVLRGNTVDRRLIPRLLAMSSLGELVLESAYDEGTLAELGRLRALPGLRALDLRRYGGAPERLRWRFEGDELPEAFA
jgi:hypothetical protein